MTVRMYAHLNGKNRSDYYTSYTLYQVSLDYQLDMYDNRGIHEHSDLSV